MKVNAESRRGHRVLRSATLFLFLAGVAGFAPAQFQCSPKDGSTCVSTAWLAELVASCSGSGDSEPFDPGQILAPTASEGTLLRLVQDRVIETFEGCSRLDQHPNVCEMVSLVDPVDRHSIGTGWRTYAPYSCLALAFEAGPRALTGDDLINWSRSAAISYYLLRRPEPGRGGGALNNVRLHERVTSGSRAGELSVQTSDSLGSYVLRDLGFSQAELEPFRLPETSLSFLGERAFDEGRFADLMSIWLELEVDVGRQDMFFRVLDYLRAGPPPVSEPPAPPAGVWTIPEFTVTPEEPAQLVPLDTGVGTRWRLSFDVVPGPEANRQGKRFTAAWLVGFDRDRHRGLNVDLIGSVYLIKPCTVQVRGGLGVDQVSKSKDKVKFCSEPDVPFRLAYEVDLSTGKFLLSVGEAVLEGTIAGDRGPYTGPVAVGRGSTEIHGEEAPWIGTTFSRGLLEVLE